MLQYFEKQIEKGVLITAEDTEEIIQNRIKRYPNTPLTQEKMDYFRSKVGTYLLYYTTYRTLDEKQTLTNIIHGKPALELVSCYSDELDTLKNKQFQYMSGSIPCFV